MMTCVLLEVNEHSVVVLGILTQFGIEAKIMIDFNVVIRRRLENGILMFSIFSCV